MEHPLHLHIVRTKSSTDGNYFLAGIIRNVGHLPSYAVASHTMSIRDFTGDLHLQFRFDASRCACLFGFYFPRSLWP